ncbi:MAG: hypothetical protein KAT41_05965 [Candidatus Marinimicrobia bacterium]|nr:hypothetical protein [Candidatus Neomarinimicrobiota bacterium]
MGIRVIFCLLLVFSSFSFADDLGDYFYSKQHYFESVTEYKRLLFFKKYSNKDEILYKIAKAYYSSGQKESAANTLLELISDNETSDFDRDGLILLAKIYWELYDYQSMRNVLDYLGNILENDKKEQIQYIKAWTYIYQANWEEGIEELRSLGCAECDALIQDVENVSSVPKKSKKAAIILSNIIPGSGQFYAGDYENALYSFALVGSITASIIANVYQKVYFVALIKYLFLYSRYSRGGLKNLAKRIDRENVDAIGEYLKKVSEKYAKPIELLEKMKSNI